MDRSGITRRGALSVLASGLAAPATAAERPIGPQLISFAHGVASGDPRANGAVLWTRVSSADPNAGALPVSLQVLEAEGDEPIFTQTGLTAAPDRDFTVKFDLTSPRLKPGRRYRYQFKCGSLSSPIGWFRTLPEGAIDSLTLAVACCALYPGGYFHAYRAIADLAELDAVIFLGDYIYEYGPADYGAATGRQTGRLPIPDHECVSLADYRARFAQARADPDLQAAHARAAWICAWDDHELANDAATGGAQNHQPAYEGDWAARKAAAIRAYYEWMPIREPMTGPDFAAWRSFAFGNLARVIMLETRLTGRDRQLSFSRSAATEATAQTLRDALADPARRMIGADQEAWLARELTDSAGRQAWQIIGSGVLMARARQIDLKAALGETAFAKLTAAQRRTQISADLPYLLDSWDGYPAARERVYQAIAASRANALVLSGDTHNFWMNRLHDAAGRAIAAELGAGPISSPTSAPPSAPNGLDARALFLAQNPDLVAYEPKANGFGLVNLSRQSARCDWIAVSDITQPSYAVSTLARFEVERGDTGGIGAVRRLPPR